MKNNYFPTEKIFSEKSGHVLHFCKFPLMSGLIEHSWTLISASAFSLLLHVILVE